MRLRRSGRPMAVLLPVALIAAGGIGPYAQDLPKTDEVVAPRALVSLSGVHAGGSARLAIVGDILPGWHVNAHVPSEDFLIPTEVHFDDLPGVTFGKATYPEGDMVTFEFAGKALRVYEKSFVVGVPFEVGASVSPGPLTVQGALAYQPCNDRICLAPTRVRFSTELRVARPGEAVQPMHAEIFDRLGGAGGAAAPGAPAGREGAGKELSGASPLVFGLILLGGLALNLTPCVYPLIPITVAFFGSQVSRSALGTFGLSSLYVLGMAITYSTLGVVVALTGGLFGAALQNPFVLAFVALVLVALALSMFGFYEFRIPGTSGLGSKRGALGALFMGLVVGLVAAPCIGPFVVALLAAVAREGDPILGFWKSFTLSIGLGLPYLVLGSFSGGLSRLPRSGEWMEGVKHVFGLILIIMAGHFLSPVLPQPTGRWLAPALTVAAALWLLLFERAGGPRFAWPRRGAALAGLLVAAWLSYPAPAAGIDFAPYSGTALAAATRDRRPVLIDFTADWCVPCREYEHKVFSDRRVIERSRGFVTLKADLTRTAAPEVQAMIEAHGIFGPPTIVFIGADGRELEELRLVGYVGPEEFLRRMEAAASS